MPGFPPISKAEIRALVLCGVAFTACGGGHASSAGQAAKNHRGATQSAPGLHAGARDAASPSSEPDTGSPSSEGGAPLADGGSLPDGADGLNPVAAENQQPGTIDWQITQAASNHEVEGYASTTSAAAGDVVTLFIDTSEAHTVRWELYRLGYYGGTGGRLMAVGDPISVSPQNVCPVDAVTGLIECTWNPSATVIVDPTWVSGQYLFKLVRDDGFESYVPLVVREDAHRHAPILYQSSVSTWQAYNLWGGTSLYANVLPAGAVFTDRRATKVSFDRPYEYQRTTAEAHPEIELGAGHLFLAERYMLSWLEMKGYDVSYVTNLDVDADPQVLDDRKLFLDVGHDEYWTQGERDAVDAAKDAGVSLAFFSANDAYWRIRLGPSSGGQSRRIVTCYKSASADPEGKTPLATDRFRDQPHFEPEDELVGQMYDLWTNLDAFPLVVGDATHWIYQGTGVAVGDTLPHIVGYEWDDVQDDKTSPNVEVPATSSAFNQLGVNGLSNVTVYYPTATSFVFAAGTIEWSWALGKPGYEDDRVKRITENVLARAGFAPNAPTIVSPQRPPSDIGRSRVTVLAGSGNAGKLDGNGTATEFKFPAGVAASQGAIFVVDHDNSVIRKIAQDGTVTTYAGCGKRKFADGAGTDACFDLPTGIAAADDGTLYVADTENHRIRAIDVSANVTTLAGNGSANTADATDPGKAGIAYPRGLAIGPDGAVYVASDTSAIRRIGSNGVTTVVSADNEVSGVAVGKDGVVYVVETGAGRVSMVQNGALVPLVNPLGVFGDQSGPGDTAMLRPAEGIVVDGDQLVVTDSANFKVRSIALSADHRVTTLLGDGCAGRRPNDGVDARVINPRGIALLPDGYVVADTGHHRILKIETPPRRSGSN
ncbi:MAG TPA: N,N-dimethylformamidase beta subunit family domain-containing protein [Polyangiaceae bacterium]|nr:N,N-dimethylformamidase beta subunit family domain-containing protein [Polyangiaceae bacterium]